MSLDARLARRRETAKAFSHLRTRMSSFATSEDLRAFEAIERDLTATTIELETLDEIATRRGRQLFEAGETLWPSLD